MSYKLGQREYSISKFTYEMILEYVNYFISYGGGIKNFINDA